MTTRNKQSPKLTIGGDRPVDGGPARDALRDLVRELARYQAWADQEATPNGEPDTAPRSDLHPLLD